MYLNFKVEFIVILKIVGTHTFINSKYLCLFASNKNT